MKALNGFSTGFRNVLKAIPFIFNNNLWWVFIIPILLNIILYSSGFILMDYLGELSQTYVEKWFTGTGESKFLTMLPGILLWVVKIIIQVLFFFVFVYFSGYVILIILSPLFAWLSERTDQILNKTDFPFSWGQFFKDIWRGIKLAVRNMFFELGITILVLIASLLPGINIISGPVSVVFLFIISSYFYGFSYMDYTNERRRLNEKESIKLVRKYKGLAVANGGLFSLSLLIPFCGLMLAGFSAIICTVGATLAMNELPEIKMQNI